MNAELGVRRLMKTADAVVLAPNDALIEADLEPPLDMAFDAMDKIILHAIMSIFEKFSGLEAKASR